MKKIVFLIALLLTTSAYGQNYGFGLNHAFALAQAVEKGEIANFGYQDVLLKRAEKICLNNNRAKNKDVLLKRAEKICLNDNRAKNKAVIVSNDEGYVLIKYEKDFYFILPEIRYMVLEIIKGELQKKINIGSDELRKAKNELEKNEDLVADYTQRLKADKKIDPINGGHRHEIENALNLYQGRLSRAKMDYDNALKRYELCNKEVERLYKDLEVIVAKYNRVCQERENNKGFACIL